jgi:hypothetical protein
MESRTRLVEVVREEFGVEQTREQRGAELEQVRSATVTIVRAD